MAEAIPDTPAMFLSEGMPIVYWYQTAAAAMVRLGAAEHAYWSARVDWARTVEVAMVAEIEDAHRRHDSQEGKHEEQDHGGVPLLAWGPWQERVGRHRELSARRNRE